MPRAATVHFQDTQEGYVDENTIPKEGFESHYLAAGSTRGQSSFPVVDDEEFLRRDSVVQAFEQGEESERDDIRRKARWLSRYFDDDPLSEREYVNTIEIDHELSFQAESTEDINFNQFDDQVGDGFNEHGVRENHEDGELQSVDVLYQAMEPGPPERRNGVRITEEFLDTVGGKDYTGLPPFMKDHTKNSSEKIGDVQEVFYSDSEETLMLMNRIPNTGAPAHDEAIARYTHDPPSWRNGSVGFGKEYTAVRNNDGEPELRDATLQEFSTTPFPGGYDDGGLARAFAEAVEDMEFDDPADGGRKSGENSAATFGISTETITID